MILIRAYILYFEHITHIADFNVNLASSLHLHYNELNMKTDNYQTEWQLICDERRIPQKWE